MDFKYPDSLPITSHKDEIIETLRSQQVVIIEGDTGSGKTTQLPKMCLEFMGGEDVLVGCTQPRRIAATSVASRVAEELGELGECVGYKIRFHDRTSKSTKIKFMTDGVLLAETRNDKRLGQYNIIIVDEAHERSLNIDFLLGYLKQLLPKRPDLKVLITSATIDTTAFSKHFFNAPIISVSGRNYPVEVQYHPLDENDEFDSDSQLEHCVNVVVSLFKQRPVGDILVFLATERDIRECCRLLEKKIEAAHILPLFGRLSAQDQQKIFRRTDRLKVIVATNVAETSLTVPGIRYVIDSGVARIAHYNSRAKTTSLPVTKISRASCDQRKGRCGRIGPGICLRLYSEEDYLNRPEFTVPELKRSNLAEVILQMTSLKLGNPNTFPFLDPPLKNYINEGYQLLRELGAIDASNRLTKTGQFMSKLPIDPCISRIFLEAVEHNCLREIKIICALLAIQDPKIRPAEKEKQADEAHQQFHHPHSDFLTLLNIWNSFHEYAGKRRSWSKLKKFCTSNFLSFQRMREWFDLHDQLDRLLSKTKEFKENVGDSSYEQIHRSLLAGFHRNLAKKKQSKIYSGTHNKELMIFPGSAQFSKNPEWIIAASFIETNNLYAHTVSQINVEWIEPSSKHLCKYSWTNPRWQKRTGQVIADESVTLFGLPLSSGRKVNFGKRHPKNVEQARTIFIQSALVEGQLSGSYSFLKKNLNKRDSLEKTEDRLRVRNLVVDDIALQKFYHERLPKEVYDQRTLNRYLKKTPKHHHLYMSEKHLLLRNFDEKELIDFPDRKTVGSVEILIEYNFSPGNDNDGVSFRIPSGMAQLLAPEQFEWLVPGLLREKLVFMLKSLPKSIRKRFVPLNESVDRLLDDMVEKHKPFLSSLEHSIFKQFKLQVARKEWTTQLPLHLQPRYVLIDEKGNECGSGRNLRELSDIYSQKNDKNAQNTITQSKINKKILSQWKDSEHTSWTFEGLPEKIINYNNKKEVSSILYTVIKAVPDKGTVKIDFTDNPVNAEKLTGKGQIYLLGLQFKAQLKSLKKLCTTKLSGPSTLLFTSLGLSRNQLVDSMVQYLIFSCVSPLPKGLMPLSVYEEKIALLQKQGLFTLGQQYLEQIMSGLRKRNSLHTKLEKVFAQAKAKGHTLPSQKDFFQQELETLLPSDFFCENRTRDFKQVYNHLSGLDIRIDRFYVDPRKDAQKAKQLHPYLMNLEELSKNAETFSDAAYNEYILYKEMINDFKLVVFAPEIKPGRKVSPKTLKEQYQRILSMS